MQLRYLEQDFKCDISEEQFASLSEPLLLRLRSPVERALRDATIRAAELDNVVLAGGATRMPAGAQAGFAHVWPLPGLAPEPG